MVQNSISAPRTQEKYRQAGTVPARHWRSVFLIGFLVFLGFVPLFTGRMLYDEDGLFYFLPAFKFYWDALHEGTSFLIVSQVFSGFSLYLSQIGGFVEPVNYFLFSFFPFPFVYIFRIFLSYLLGALLMYLFSREWGLGRSASLLSSFTFISAQHILGGTQVIRSFSLPFLVGIFYVTLKIFRMHPIRVLPLAGFVFLGVILFLNGMLSGYMQLNLHAIAALGIFLIFLAWQESKRGVHLSLLSVLFLSVLAIGIVGLALFYPYLSRVLELIPFTGRSGGVSWQEAGGAVGVFSVIPALIGKIGGMAGLLFLPTFRMPDALGGGFYAGFLAVIAVVSSFWMKKSKGWHFFFGLFIFSLLATMPPFSWLFFTHTPFRYFRNVGFWLIFPGTFAFSILAGIGIDQFLKIVKPEERVRIFQRVSPLVVGLIAVYLISLLSLVKRDLIVFNPMAWKDIIFSLMLWAAVFLWFWLASYMPQQKKAISALFVATSAASFILPVWILSYKDATSVSMDSIFQKPWVYQEIKKRENDNTAFRTYNFYPGDSQWHLFVKPYNPTVQGLHDFQREVAMQRLSPALHEYASIRGLDNLVPRRYIKVLNYIDTKKTFSEAYGISSDGSQQVFLIDATVFELLGMMSVKYMWSMLPLSPEYENVLLRRVASATSTGSILALHLYENKRFLPRVTAPPHIAFLEENEDNFKNIIEQGFDFHEIGFIECKGCGAIKVVDQIPAEIHIDTVKNDLLRFRVNAIQDSWVIISNSFLPRWHASVDSKEVPIHYANYIYQGIRVPAGSREVELRYRW